MKIEIAEIQLQQFIVVIDFIFIAIPWQLRMNKLARIHKFNTKNSAFVVSIAHDFPLFAQIERMDWHFPEKYAHAPGK